jgi:hypothetical protein
MDVREKLVELLNGVLTTEDVTSSEQVADHLIANGVTVQELDGCEYCKEDNEGFRRMFGAFSITNPFHGKEWFINTGHCKPRQICFCPMCGRRLTQPPKGE